MLGLLRLPPRLRRTRFLTMLLALLVLLAVLTPLYVVYKPPRSLIAYFARRWPDVLWRLPIHPSSRTDIVALTIDDAPSTHTQEILNVLREHDARATFFVIGAQAEQPGGTALLRDIVAAGHELGNHAMHDEASRSLDPAELTAQIQRVEALIDATYAALNKVPPPRYFRPGSGFFSARMRAQLHSLGYKMVLGSVYPHDAQISSVRLNAAHVLSGVRKGDIVVCHDRRSWTVGMLKLVLPELARRGFVVRGVSESLKAAEGVQVGESG